MIDKSPFLFFFSSFSFFVSLFFYTQSSNPANNTPTTSTIQGLDPHRSRPVFNTPFPIQETARTSARVSSTANEAKRNKKNHQSSQPC